MINDVKITIGIMIRPEVAVIDEIKGLNNSNFLLENGSSFFIKNEGNEPIVLEVIPAGIDDRKFVEVTFAPGWNFELVREIRQTPDVKTRLLFGY